MITSVPSEVVAAYLVFAGYAVRPTSGTVDWAITKGAFIPDEPDKALGLTDIIPMFEGKIQRTGETVTKPRVQIVSRAKDYTVALTKLQQISNFLSAVNRPLVTTNVPETVLVEGIKIIYGPVFIGQEEKNRRQMFSLVVQPTITEIT